MFNKDDNQTVAILMATFNGELYIKEQIQSILNQIYLNWRLYIRDDGSIDNTLKVINELAAEDERITLISDEYGNLGPAHNFEVLAKYALDSEGEYFFFADQDDVWNEDKVGSQVELMQEMEVKYGKETPLLVHGDLEVIDQKLGSLHRSFMEYQGISNQEDNPLSVLLVQNFVTGCTVLVNRHLLEFALPIPKEALMHDWWFALCAVSLGRIEYVNKPLVKYRQHGSNEVGAKSIKSYMNPFRTNWMVHWLKGRENFLRSMHQVRILAERIKEHDPENENLKLIEPYASLLSLPRWQRIKVLKKNSIHCQSWLRHCLMLSRLLSLPEQK